MSSYKPRNVFARQAMPTAAGALTGSTVGAATFDGAVELQIGNNAGAARYGIVWVVPSGGSRTTVTQVGPTFTIPSTDMPVIYPIKDVLQAGDAIHAWCSGADVSIVGSTVQET